MEQKYYADPSSHIIGDVTVGDFSSIFPCAVLRGDLSSIRVRSYSNIQDSCVIHTDMQHIVEIGNFVTVGHGAVIHGSAVSDCCVIGIRSIILNGSTVGHGSIVAAGTVVKENSVIPPFSLVIGNPMVIKENRFSDYRVMIHGSLIYYYLSCYYKKDKLPDKNVIRKLYRSASQESERLNSLLMSGESPSSLANLEIVPPFGI
jgi:carbonic anhydrase/acetyltransferase-like protein (isoleucine patch superfamily)